MKNTADKSTSLTLTQKAALVTRLMDHIACECKEVDTESAYDEMLDSIYDLSSVGGPFACMCASRVLREVDPTAYHCGFSDWLDGEDHTEIDGVYYRNDDIDDARESFVDELRETETGLEMDVEAELDAEVGTDGTSEEQLAEIRAEISLAESHSF